MCQWESKRTSPRHSAPEGGRPSSLQCAEWPPGSALAANGNAQSSPGAGLGPLEGTTTSTPGHLTSKSFANPSALSLPSSPWRRLTLIPGDAWLKARSHGEGPLDGSNASRRHLETAAQPQSSLGPRQQSTPSRPRVAYKSSVEQAPVRLASNRQQADHLQWLATSRATTRATRWG